MMDEEKGKFEIEKQKAERDIIQAGRDIIIQQAAEKEKLNFPLKPNLNNQTAPEVNFVGRKDMLDTITGWYKNPEVRIGGLIGWGGVGKSALVRKWYDELGANNIQPDGIFWWGFYRNASLEQFLNALLRYVSGGQIDTDTIKSTWEKTEKIKEYIGRGEYLIILDGLEQMQKAESGGEFSKMINRELTELLHSLADVPKADGMCLITTRFPLKDLDGWENRGYENRPLVDLSVPDALLMLKKRGVKGSDEEMTGIIKRYKGHALSLTSLAGYLSRYYDGDIKQTPDIEFVLGDKERFKDVNKLLRKYAKKMSEVERRFLNIFSLFRQEITEQDFGGVIRHEIKSTKFNKLLIKLSDLDFRDLVGGLVDWRLISYDETKKTYATHPLIKTYFESDFGEEDKKLCHKRIYEYIGEYAPERADTLEEMQPLFEQVYHGCAAGLYDESLKLYFSKINGPANKYFLTDIIGAENINFELSLNFFPSNDFLRIPLVTTKHAKCGILNEIGYSLKKIGKASEAEKSLINSLNFYEKHEDIQAYLNLAELQFLMGKINTAIKTAKKALKLSKDSSARFYRAKTYLAYFLTFIGEVDLAKQYFYEVIGFNQEPSSIEGVFYSDFLVLLGNYDAAAKIVNHNLDVCKESNWIEYIGHSYRGLSALKRIKQNFLASQDCIFHALEISKKTSVADLEIQTLLERGRLGLDMRRHENAVCDADNVLKICGRTGFKLYEPGAEIVLAKAYLGQKDLEQAERFANSAYEKAVGMKYRWAEGDAADLLGEIYSVRGDKVKARKWLKKAVGCRKEILDPKVKESEGKLAGSE